MFELVCRIKLSNLPQLYTELRNGPRIREVVVVDIIVALARCSEPPSMDE